MQAINIHRLVCLLAILLFSSSIYANNIEKETHIFAIKGNDTLRLDRYYLPHIMEDTPCILFVFGGGFFSGTRDDKQYLNYFYQLAQSGYNVLSIDYRLGLKDLDVENIKSPIEVIPLLKRTINDAVADLFDATNYTLTHAKEWKINKHAIIASGSSAGAIAVLQAEYELANKTKLTHNIPDSFRYAGIISFAGAILSLDGDLQWKQNSAPMLLFHGNADGNVPYDKLEFFNVGLYGSSHIAKQLEKLKSPYYFVDVDNGTHTLATSPMNDNMHDIKNFIEKLVIAKQRLMIHNTVQTVEYQTKKNNFTIVDYLINNFAPAN